MPQEQKYTRALSNGERGNALRLPMKIKGEARNQIKIMKKLQIRAAIIKDTVKKLRKPERPFRKRKEQHGRAPAARAPFTTEHPERSAELESKINWGIYDVVGKALPPLERERLLALLTEARLLLDRIATNGNQTQGRTSRKVRKEEQKELHHPGANHRSATQL